jgi:hypothetical protein
MRKDKVFQELHPAQNEFQDVLGKVEDTKKDFVSYCFARMRSVILSVLYYDVTTKTRMTKFNGEELVKIGALQE